MTLRAVASAFAVSIMNNQDTAFGWPITLTNPAGLAAPLVGRSQDIAQLIDPETGQVVSGRMATAALATSDIFAAGFTELPRAIADASIKPWLVSFDDVNGSSYLFKVSESNPDNTLDCIVLHLERYTL